MQLQGASICLQNGERRYSGPSHFEPLDVGHGLSVKHNHTLSSISTLFIGYDMLSMEAGERRPGLAESFYDSGSNSQ